PQDIRLKRETESAIVEAQRHILEAHAQRLSAEITESKKTGRKPNWVDEFQFEGDKVTSDDILSGRAPRPRVLDMFAGGGAIPLEALRLGCETYALDLNPVAHIIERNRSSSGEQAGALLAGALGVDGLGEILQSVFVLQAAGLHYGQNAFDE